MISEMHIKCVEHLTKQQHKIMNKLCNGMVVKEIAKELNIEPGTVKLHMRNILNKLGVHSQVHAAVAYTIYQYRNGEIR